jgi:dienelactone hydrolase
MPRDLLEDFTTFDHRSDDAAFVATHTVYRTGEGPAVVVLAEMPGITPKVAAFARRVRDEGFTVFMPHLFGRPGEPPSQLTYVKAIAPACVSKEFAAFARGTTAPISLWLRSLARRAHEECGGPGVGALGMCWTGGFALGMMVDPIMLAPVLSQPSLPLNLSKRHKADLHLSPDDLAAVKARAAEGQCVLGLRFTNDPLSPPDRFETLRRELGDAFIGVEIDSSPGNAWGIRRLAHSVLTEDLVEDPSDHPTAQALGQVLQFFRERLLA